MRRVATVKLVATRPQTSKDEARKVRRQTLSPSFFVVRFSDHVDHRSNHADDMCDTDILRAAVEPLGLTCIILLTDVVLPELFFHLAGVGAGRYGARRECCKGAEMSLSDPPGRAESPHFLAKEFTVVH
jgi:hypothetical protein